MPPRAISGRLYLVVAVLIFGASNAVTRKLTELGMENLIGGVGGRNPISFCNVLFAGNLLALIAFGLLHRRDWNRATLQKISPRQWGTLTLVAVLSSAVVPMLLFTALSLTAVNNVVLLGQVDTPVVLAFSVLLLGDRVNRWVVGGAVVVLVGVALTALIHPPMAADAAMMMDMEGFQLGLGEGVTLLAAVFSAIATLISRVSLKQIPLGIFNVYRTIVGTIFFFMTASSMYGPGHFMDVASPFLWQWMLPYGAVIVVGGQLAWFQGLKLSTASEVSFATAFDPLTGVLAAFLLLGEQPTLGHYIGGAVILVGIVLNQVGDRRLNCETTPPTPSPAEVDGQVAFKGI